MQFEQDKAFATLYIAIGALMWRILTMRMTNTTGPYQQNQSFKRPTAFPLL